MTRAELIAERRAELRYKHLPTFWHRVLLLDAPTDCWDWLGSLTLDGYGVLKVDNRQVYAHRHAWELLRAEIPERMTIDHLCLNKACCNPMHLEVVTREENSLRGEKNRIVRTGGRVLAARDRCKNDHPYIEGSYRLVGGTRVYRRCARNRFQKFKDRRRGA